MKNFIFIIIGLFIFIHAQAQDLPFNASPKNGTTLPTALIPGQTAVAYYTISNNTPLKYPITGNFIKYFPPNVTQLLTDTTYTDICQTTFDLQPKGSSGDSCTLKLQISNPVVTFCGPNNAQGCLFICMSDRASCGGTLYPLHVTQATSVAVGNTIDGSGNYLPLAYTSTNGGQTWALSTTSVNSAPSGQTQGALNAVACNGALCSTVGYTFNTSFDFVPLSYSSINNGLTWTPSPTVNLPPQPASFQSGIFNQLSCNALSCVTVGNFYFLNYTSPAEPLAYTSSDFGAEWNLSHRFPPAVPDRVQKTLWGVSCNGNACAAVGQDNDLATNGGIPLGYYSIDGGVNWIASPTFTVPNTQGILFSTQCQGTHCVAAGLSYSVSSGINTFNDPTSLIYTSDDDGQTWSAPLSLTPPLAKTYGLLWGVTCLQTNCVTVGQAYDTFSSDSIPIAYTSMNGGVSWVTSPTVFPLPVGKTQGLLYTVSCTNSYCIAVGQAYNTLFVDPIPVSYYSQDSGVTWTLSPPLPLPDGITAGILIGANSGT